MFLQLSKLKLELKQAGDAEVLKSRPICFNQVPPAVIKVIVVLQSSILKNVKLMESDHCRIGHHVQSS